jgi:hypothetical protein
MVVAGDIGQATGYLVDLKLLSDIITRQVIRDVDHRNLNTDVPWLKGRVPSAETWPGHSGNGSGRSCGYATRLRTWDCLTISITDLTRDAGRCPAGRTSDDGAAWRPGLLRPGRLVLRGGDDCGG